MPENKHILLAVLAHPDDETFGMGGTLALYARQGVDVHLICATRGEVGSVEPKFMEGFESIGEMRGVRAELCGRLAGVGRGALPGLSRFRHARLTG